MTKSKIIFKQIITKYSGYTSILFSLVIFLMVALTVFKFTLPSDLHNGYGPGVRDVTVGFWKLSGVDSYFTPIGYAAIVLFVINCILSVVGLIYNEGKILRASISLMFIVAILSFMSGIAGVVSEFTFFGKTCFTIFFYRNSAATLTPVGIAMITILSLLACSGIALCAYSVFKKYFSVRTKKAA